ncbi:hypothetical protein [Haladaptatus salinisoli]|uniref:hypothetical protein n=1 Tax=Haladaptatus salinisoli TaxID=2884876 RepID=UPI001D0B130C|nr:hypothetical protein [Haladaptatus salinisoli]
MPDDREDLLQRLNEMQAVDGLDSETREIIGLLGGTIRSLGAEIDDLQRRVAELEEAVDEDDDRRKRMWYSERDSSE